MLDVVLEKSTNEKLIPVAVELHFKKGNLAKSVAFFQVQKWGSKYFGMIREKSTVLIVRGPNIPEFEVENLDFYKLVITLRQLMDNQEEGFSKR